MWKQGREVNLKKFMLKNAHATASVVVVQTLSGIIFLLRVSLSVTYANSFKGVVLLEL